jgi:hypothetical protein
MEGSGRGLIKGIVTWFSGCRRGLDLLNSYRSVTTSNYNRFTNSHTVQFTRAHTYVFSASSVFTCFLVTAANGGRSPSSGFQNWPLPQLPASHSNGSQGLNRSSPLTHQPTHSTPLTDWLTPHYPACNIPVRTGQKTPFFCLRAVAE